MDPRVAAGILLATTAWVVAAAGAAHRWFWNRQDPSAWMPSRSFAGAVEVRGAVKHPGVQVGMAGRRVREVLAEAGPKGKPRGGILEARVAEGALVEVDRDGTIRIGRMPGERLLALDLPIQLEQASIEDLQALPGIGPVLAARIAEWRDARGAIRSVNELVEVPGIGAKTLERIGPLLEITGGKTGIPPE